MFITGDLCGRKYWSKSCPKKFSYLSRTHRCSVGSSPYLKRKIHFRHIGVSSTGLEYFIIDNIKYLAYYNKSSNIFCMLFLYLYNSEVCRVSLRNKYYKVFAFFYLRNKYYATYIDKFSMR